MTIRDNKDRAAIWLGAASIASVGFIFVKRELQFLDIPKPGIAVALVLGVLAITGGWLANRALVLASAAGFLLAAVGQVVAQTLGAAIANGSNGSTFGLWLGLAAGLIAVGLTPPRKP